MTQVSINKVLQDAIVALLVDQDEFVRPDERTVSVTGDIPMAAFSQKSMPKISVMRPETLTRTPLTTDSVRIEYEINILLIDSQGGTFEASLENRERLDLLAHNVCVVLDQALSLSLQCQPISILPNSMEYEFQADPEGLGHNLTSLLLTVRIPAVVPVNLQITV